MTAINTQGRPNHLLHLTNYMQSLTDLQNRYDGEPKPAKRFELLADMARVLDAVIYAVRQATK